jgi:poly(hydroxyalkanoate) granule-associated protein
MIAKAKQVQAEVTQSAYRIWLAGLGAVAYAQESGGQLFEDLVKRGRELEAQARLTTPDVGPTLRDATDKAFTAWQQLSKGLDEQVTAALHRMGVPTRHEIATLSKRVELLTASVEKLKPKGKVLAKPIERTATRTTASGAATTKGS